MTITVLIIGQSNAERMGSEGADLSANASLTEWNGSTFVAPTTNGHIAYGNAMIAALGEPVRIVNSAVGGTALLAAADSGSGHWEGDPTPNADLWGNAKTALNAAVGSLSADVVLWSQGVRDASSGVVNGAQYSAGFQNFITDQVRVDITNTSTLAALPVVFMPLGSNQNVGAVDADWQDIREGQKDAINALSISIMSATTLDLPMADDIHYSNAGQITLGTRAALSHQKLLGLISNNLGPQILSASNVSITQTRITLQQNSGTDFTPATAITGFAVTGATVSGADRESSTLVLLTHSALQVGVSRDIAYLYGADPDDSASIHDNSSSSLPLEWANNLISEAPRMNIIVGLHPDVSGDIATTATVAQGAATCVSPTRATIVPANYKLIRWGIRAASGSAALRTAAVGLYPSVAGNPNTQALILSDTLSVDQGVVVTNYQKEYVGPEYITSVEQELTAAVTESGGNANFPVADWFSVSALGAAPRDDVLAVSGEFNATFETDTTPNRDQVLWLEFEPLATTAPTLDPPQVRTPSGTLVSNGATISSPAVLYISPAGYLTDVPNGKPVANFLTN